MLLTRHRLYDPETAHWLSRDPLGEDGGINLYGYVGNNPVNYWDPNGESAVAVEVAGGSALAVATAYYLSTPQGQKAARDFINATYNLIDHLDAHIDKVMRQCPTGNPDPNDPNQDPVKKWIKEIKAAVKNLKQELKKIPNNKTKREPIEKAIQRGEEAIKNWEDL